MQQIVQDALDISIHVLRVEDDGFCVRLRGEIGEFQSTSSVWRTTIEKRYLLYNLHISIHVLRVEDDFSLKLKVYRMFISIHVLRVEDDSKNREKSLFAFI